MMVTTVLLLACGMVLSDNACSSTQTPTGALLVGKFRLAEGVVGAVRNDTARAEGLLPASQAQL